MPFRLRYTDVILSVTRLVVLIYNKLTEVNQVDSRSMFKTLSNIIHSIDEKIVSSVINEICVDLNLVASRKA